jgi:hypothetical protein
LTLADFTRAGIPVTIILDTSAEVRLASQLTDQTPGAVVRLSVSEED